MKSLVRLCLVAVAWLLATVAHAAPISFVTTMTGPQESPPVASPGLGIAWVTFDPVANFMRVVVNFAGLIGTTTIAHIHCCVDPPGTVAPATVVPTFPGFPTGVTSGSYDMTFDTESASTYNPAFITAAGGTAQAAEAALFAGLLAGQAYFNIHTTFVGSGEIRGFLQQVPEPATLVLLGIALFGAGLAHRRR